MTKNINFVSHKKSKVKLENGKPQLPLASALVEGEIAINYAKDVETLSIKNESGSVVTFSSDNYYTEQKLGSGFTGANSAKTVTEVIDNLDLGNEVVINSGITPTEPSIEIWIDESITPAEVDVYTQAEVDAKIDNVVSITSGGTYTATIVVDESTSLEIEFYTKSQVDAIAANLQRQIDELKNK